MGELAARLGLHAAVDRLVVAEAITVDQIVPLVRAYDPGRAVPRRPPARPSSKPAGAEPADRGNGGTDDRQADEPGGETPMIDRASNPDDRDAKVVDDEEPGPEKDQRSTPRELPAPGWAAHAAQLLGRVIPTASDALHSMAERTRVIEPIDAARRIRALWLAKQAADLAIGNAKDPDGISDDAIEAALAPVVEQFPPDVEKYPPERYRPPRADSVRTGEGLVGVMRLLSDIQTAEGFHQQFASAASEFLRADVAWAAAAECHDSTMYVDVTANGVTDTDVAAVMTTSLAIPNTTNLDVAELKERMKPDQWPESLPTFWCQMNPCGAVSAPEFVRQEVVGDFEPSIPCETVVPWFRPILRFCYRDVPDGDGFELQFALASGTMLDPENDPAQDGRFLVDAGAMNVRIRDGVILVRTSKVLLLSPPISAIGLTILACAMGYGDMGTALLAKALE